MLSALRGIKNRLISLALANRVQLCAPLSRSFSALFSSAFWTCLPVVLLYQCNAFQSVRASDCPVICLLLVSCLSRPKHLSHNKLRYKASPFLGTGLQAFACYWVHFWEWTAKTTVYTQKKTYSQYTWPLDLCKKNSVCNVKLLVPIIYNLSKAL